MSHRIDAVKTAGVLTPYANGDDFDVRSPVACSVYDPCMKPRCDAATDSARHCCYGYNEVDELVVM